MRPAVYFPELRLGEQTVPAYSAVCQVSANLDRSGNVLSRDDHRLEAVEPRKPMRRRSQSPHCVLEA
jgi:hypothetical protein